MDKNLTNKIKNIKSPFILNQKIFSYLFEKRKLDIISYNKNLQKFINVNIENYRRVSKRFKIGEKNGKGKEYLINTNILIFEGN